MSPPGGETAPGYVSPDGGIDEYQPRRRRKSPSDLRREARRITERQEAARTDRGDGWGGTGNDPMLVAHVDTRLRRVEADKRDLTQDFYRRLPGVDPGAGKHLSTAQYRKDR